MNSLIIIGIVVFAAAFGSVYFMNLGESKFFFTPVYAFEPGDFLSEINAFLFVFVFSMLFFGVAAPVALGMEGLKYASIISAGGAVFDVFFAIPQMIAAFSATIFGAAIISDYSGKGNLLEEVKNGAKFLACGFALMVFLFLARSLIVQ